jgi:hypothetical protein
MMTEAGKIYHFPGAIRHGAGLPDFLIALFAETAVNQSWRFYAHPFTIRDLLIREQEQLPDEYPSIGSLFDGVSFLKYGHVIAAERPSEDVL